MITVSIDENHWICPPLTPIGLSAKPIATYKMVDTQKVKILVVKE